MVVSVSPGAAIPKGSFKDAVNRLVVFNNQNKKGFSYRLPEHRA